MSLPPVRSAAAVHAAPRAAFETVQLRMVSDADGVPVRTHVPVTHRGRPSTFLLDTGSPTSFLATGATSVDGQPVAGTVVLNGRPIALPGRSLEPDTARQVVAVEP